MGAVYFISKSKKAVDPKRLTTTGLYDLAVMNIHRDILVAIEDAIRDININCYIL
jgi:hypothetical protein